MKSGIKINFTSGALYALYMFSFLLTEFTVNVRCEKLLGAENVNAVYALGIICTTLGYFFLTISRSLIHGETARKGLLASCGCIYLIGAVTMLSTGNVVLYLASSFLSLFSFGYIGAYVHYALSMLLSGSESVGKIIGISAAAATVLQFAVQNLFITDTVFIVSIGLSLGVLILCIIKPSKDWVFENALPYDSKPELNRSHVTVLIAAVFIMSLVIGLNDGIITSLHAQKQMNIASWSRLFYALGLVIAGVAADLKKRRYLALTTVCTMLFSTVAIFFLSKPSMYVFNSVLMYFYSGFYVMYLTVTFTDLAPKTSMPTLWAGMGRIVRGVATSVIVIPAMWMFNSFGDTPILIMSCALCAAVLILLSVSGMLLPAKPGVKGSKTDDPSSVLQITAEQRLELFSARYSLTPRETEVLNHITSESKSIQEIADEMYVSRRTLQRYITSIYEKTETKSRIMERSHRD